MRTVINIALNDLRILLSNRSIWINLLIVPVIISYAVGLANGVGGSGGNAPRLLVDVIAGETGGQVDQFLADIRAANPSIVLCPMDNGGDDACGLRSAALDEMLATQRLKDETSLALIEIPVGFSAALEAGEAITIVYRSNEDASAPSYILQAVQASAQKLGAVQIATQVGANVAVELNIVSGDADRAAFADAVRENASALWAQDPVQVDYVLGQQPEPTNNVSGFSQSIPGIGTMYVLFTLLPAAATVVLQRKNGTLPRLAVMPISRVQILGGKMLANFLLGMLEYAIMFTFGYFLGVRYGSDPLAILLLMITFTLSVTALTLALTSVLHNEAQARGIGLLLTLTLCPLGGAWWPLDIVPEWMRTVGHISPVAWVMDGFNTLIFKGGDLGGVIVPLAVLAGMAVAFFAFGVWRFKFTD
ncbi:MAG: ABC transporter permease [Anaerolineae bacterium]